MKYAAPNFVNIFFIFYFSALLGGLAAHPPSRQNKPPAAPRQERGMAANGKCTNQPIGRLSENTGILARISSTKPRSMSANARFSSSGGHSATNFAPRVENRRHPAVFYASAAENLRPALVDRRHIALVFYWHGRDTESASAPSAGAETPRILL